MFSKNRINSLFHKNTKMKLFLNITFTKPISLSIHCVIYLEQKAGEAHSHSHMHVFGRLETRVYSVHHLAPYAVQFWYLLEKEIGLSVTSSKNSFQTMWNRDIDQFLFCIFFRGRVNKGVFSSYLFNLVILEIAFCLFDQNFENQYFLKGDLVNIYF